MSTTEELPYSFHGLHHTQLAIPPGAEDQIRAFYGDILGMTEIEKPPVLAARGGCWFRGGALELHFGVEPDFTAARKAHPGLLIADLDALAKRLGDAGVDVDWDDNFPAHRRFYAFDPLGNRLEFLEPEAPAGR
ncbi:VOC family protein [Actinoplanes sp. NPDC049599]|uniref:VOC family protein n=1 Tax=Actinoplanes sp. NPDC049599 TaxID=3363903 RepID=UPI0037A6467D